MQLSGLKKLKSDEISNKDLIFVQDMSESETKALLIGDLSNYIITSSNLNNSLKTGSYLGEFVGNHYGVSKNSTGSLVSYYSNTTNFLRYPNYSSASFSILSISSSYAVSSDIALSSSYSYKSNLGLTSSYVNTLIYTSSFKSDTSSFSRVSNYSNYSDYLIYNGTYNGKVYKSIISDYSYTSSFCNELPKNKLIKKTQSEYKIDPAYSYRGIFVNDSTSSAAVTSSIANVSTNAEYIEKSLYSSKSTFTENSDNTIFAYINFKLILDVELKEGVAQPDPGVTLPPENYNFIFKYNINQYKNIANPGIGYWYDNEYMVVFTGSYDSPPVDTIPSTVVLSDIGVGSFPIQTPVSFFYRTYGWPLDANKFAVAIFFGSAADGNPKNNFKGGSAGSNVSVVMYSNSSGTRNPYSCSVETVTVSNLVAGCSKV